MKFQVPGRLVACALALAAGLVGAHEFKAGSLRIIHPIARATPLDGGNGAVYLRVENAGAKADTLLGARSPEATRVELHSTSLDGGVMHMREARDGLPIPAGGALALSAGGNHLMLIGLKHALKAGEALTLKLRFAEAGEVPVEVHVEAADEGADAGQAEHHHH